MFVSGFVSAENMCTSIEDVQIANAMHRSFGHKINENRKYRGRYVDLINIDNNNKWII